MLSQLPNHSGAETGAHDPFDSIAEQLTTASAAYAVVANHLGVRSVGESTIGNLFDRQVEDWRSHGVAPLLDGRTETTGKPFDLVVVPNAPKLSTQDLISLAWHFDDDRPNNRVDSALYKRDDSGNPIFSEDYLRGRSTLAPVRFILVPNGRELEYAGKVPEVRESLFAEQSEHPDRGVRIPSPYEAICRWFARREKDAARQQLPGQPAKQQLFDVTRISHVDHLVPGLGYDGAPGFLHTYVQGSTLPNLAVDTVSGSVQGTFSFGPQLSTAEHNRSVTLLHRTRQEIIDEQSRREARYYQ